MTEQLTLFDAKRPRPKLYAPARPGNRPQEDAARMVQPHVGKQAQRILRALLKDGPLIREDICRLTGIETPAACARLWKLEDPDKRIPALLASPPLVRKNGRRRASSGIRVSVYEITEAGIEWSKER